MINALVSIRQLQHSFPHAPSKRTPYREANGFRGRRRGFNYSGISLEVLFLEIPLTRFGRRVISREDTYRLMLAKHQGASPAPPYKEEFRLVQSGTGARLREFLER